MQVSTSLVDSCLERVDMTLAKLDGSDLRDVNLNKSDLMGASLLGVDFERANIIGTNFSSTKMGMHIFRPDLSALTHFSDNKFIINWKCFTKLLTCKINKDLFTKWQFPSETYSPGFYHETGGNSRLKRLGFWQLLFNRWFFTNFRNVRIDDADTVEASDLYKYIKDQQYLDSFRRKHPILYQFWNLSSCCGYSAIRVAIWSLLAIVLFAVIYALIPITVPNWWPDFLVFGSEKLIHPDLAYESMSNSMKWFFFSFDIFTNLGIRSTHPQNDMGVIFVFLETIAGFTSLGLLISVLTNKYARRS